MKMAAVLSRARRAGKFFPRYFKFLDPPQGRPIGAAVIIVLHGERVSTFGIKTEYYDVPGRYFKKPGLSIGVSPPPLPFPKKVIRPYLVLKFLNGSLRHHRSVSAGAVGGGDLELTQNCPIWSGNCILLNLRSPGFSGQHLPLDITCLI